MTDALVLGGGLAGSGAAILLARAGRSVSLIEREPGPHHNVCGEFLSIEARDHLEALGMDPVALGGSPIDRVELASGSRLVEAPLPFTALGLSRYRLDEALLERAAGAGVDVRRGIRVNSIEGDSIRTSAGDVEGDTVLLATGKHRIRGERDEAGAEARQGNGVKLSPPPRRGCRTGPAHLRGPTHDRHAAAGGALMADNPFQTYSQSVTAPAVDAFPITPDDDTDLTQTVRAIYVGNAGDVSLVTAGGSTVTFAGLTGSMVLPVTTSRVRASGTTATGIVGLV